ncbi:hypothetical protein C8R43DRAFT_1203621 [Mycena crocata]|nr:hypothetical protein C8R43DRAFT_1203621 [Mycena crocata]
MSSVAHPDLHILKSTLGSIHESLSNFRPLAVRPPILDSSTDAAAELEDGWLQQDNIPGLKQLRDSVKIDLDGLERFLDDHASVNLPALSTNAPYLISVWSEVLCAPAPIVSILKSFLIDPSDRKSSSVKVDVVADSGRRWIRVNTIKNSRILGEFREIDSYLTDSDDDDNSEQGPSLAQTEFDNSVLRMGRGLVAAAQANPIETATGPEPPKVTLRLTRLKPCENDPRITQTIELLCAMGVDVDLGERAESEIPAPKPAAPQVARSQLLPTANINLDLSVLIALVSDLTHAPLPSSLDEAHSRFAAPPRLREPKVAGGQQHESDPATQARALTSQIQQEMLQEMGKGAMFQELRTHLEPLIVAQTVQFWTTVEARTRFFRIVSKIGGPGEKQRAEALFAEPPAETDFWAGSRYAHAFMPLLPVRIYPEDQPPSGDTPGAQFFRSMEKTCRDILAQETSAPPNGKGKSKSPLKGTEAEGERVLYSHNGFRRNRDSERATATRANARMTAHTVQSMLWGAQRGWTTLTANKTSVKALLREIKAARLAGRLAEETPKEDEANMQEDAAIWLLDPRSLAEGVRERAAQALGE